jgi:hypothetical protein
MELFDNKYVAISSEESMKDCSENTSSDFRNYFPESLFLNRDLYEVGLSEIIYMEPNTKSIVSEDKPLAPDQIESKTPKKFFGNIDGDNLVTIWKYTEVYSEVVNNARSLNELQIILNEHFRQINLNIQFVEVRIRGKLEGKTLLKYEDKEQRPLSIDSQLAEAMGFTTTVFAPGNHTSANIQNYELYSKIAKTKKLAFRLFKWVTSQFPLVEPSEYTLDALLIFSPMAFLNNRLKVQFEQEADILKINILQSGLRFKLPESVNSYLGLKPDFVFEKPQTLLILPNTIKNVQIETEPSVVQQFKKRNEILVLCDIVEPQIYGSQSLPILRSFQKTPGSNRVISKAFNPIYYIKPSRTDIRSIRIRLVNDDLTLLEKTDTPTKVILHFRKCLIC